MQHLEHPFLSQRRMAGLRQQRGVTLVEWMVSIAIGLVLVSALLMLFAQQSHTQNELQKSSRQIENGRYAMQLLREDIQLAGYYGEFSNVSSLPVPTVLPNPCATSVADLSAALPFAVQGYNGIGATLPMDFASCPLLAANHVAGTDILVVRHAEVDTFTSGLDAGRVYLQAGLSPNKQELKYVMGVAAGPTIDSTLFNLIKKDSSAAPLRKYVVHVYYVSPCSVPVNGSTCSSANTDDGGVSVPTLKRLELSVVGGVAKFSNVALVEGIDNMQFTYGFDSVASADPEADDGVPDSEDDDVADVSSWANLMTVRIHLLARNNEPSAGYKDNKVYNLGKVTTTATNDAFKRHAYSQMVRVINPSSRRDK